MGKTTRIELTPEQERWLERHFKHTRNAEAAERLGISERSLVRIARLPRYVAYQRYHLRKLGYIVPRGGFTAYYTPETRRSRRYEDRPRDSRRYVHFEFRDISEMP